MLTDNTLAQPWLVETVAQGSGGLHVQQMHVGPDGHGQLSLAGGYTDVTLIVSGLAPVTTDPASFRYTVVQNATP